MGFNWVTFIAQIVNLFVLVWLLKRFLYQPIVDALTKRQDYIENKVKNAEDAEKVALKEQKNWEKKQAEFDNQKQKRLDEALEEIEQLKKEQEEIVRQEIKNRREKMQADLNRETISLQLEIRDLMARHFLELSRKVMSDLSGLSPIEQAVLLFRKKIEKMTAAEKKNIKSILKKQDIIVSLSDKMSDKNTQEFIDFIRKAMNIDTQNKIRIQIEPDLILGVEMVIGDTVIEWNLRSYLEAFEGNLNAALSGLIVKE